ncbi:4-hydroxybenzoate polyprenyltransferase [Idiomarina aquatica]|uniref:4-hydroxybenzoate octaprenyltransferase n=1 Tax=Idiomarina aquatica TaxID=1327752 RepID=A0A4R6NXX0_9GAMM|nr:MULTISPECIES: 4-hydroxybenzoate octaprenyltransferase [Idiomarina]TDP29066.1 4-hydroxybenzoate polyprenyltransferase [Idiomarina aquatica]
MSKLNAYWRLMRADRPIGTYLLAWPTIWALLIGGNGEPSLKLFVLFMLGTFLMRSAGCVINDFADRNLDGHVSRTHQRPMPAGEVTATEAVVVFGLLLFAAFIVVLQFNTQTVMLSFAAAGVAALYPFCKRWTHLPQVVLGVAFSFGILMAFSAQNSTQWFIAGVLFVTNVIWTVMYDTEYAMADREDDLQVGIRSTAILFGRHDRLIIGLLQLITVALLTYVAYWFDWSWPLLLALAAIVGLFVYQQLLIREREPSQCFKAFLHNHYVGMTFATGLAWHYWFL